MQNKPNFQKAQMNVNMVLTVDYEKKTLGESGKNKPNSKPIQTQTKPISEKAKMNVSYIITKGYENKPRLRAKAKQTQYKPKTNPICSELACPACPERSRREPVCPEHRRRVEGVEPISEAKKMLPAAINRLRRQVSIDKAGIFL